MRCHFLLFAMLLSACASQGPASRPVFFTPPAGVASGDYGTANPFLLMDSAPDGKWLLACQAREDTNGDGRIASVFGFHGNIVGDALRPYLFLEPGAGIRIDEVLAVSPSGRFLAVVRDSTLWLLDVETREETVLASEVTPDTTSPHPPIRASFSRDGLRLLYLRPEGGRSVAVVRDLLLGTERVLDAGRGRVGQALLDPSGQWAVFDVVEDTNADGQETWPQEDTTLASATCRPPVLSSSHFGWEGDTPVRRYRRVSGGPLLQGEDVLQPLGEGMLRRAPDRSIFLEYEDGRRETWVPSSCNATLVFADAAREQVVVVCASQPDLGPLEVHGARVHQPLGWRMELPFSERSIHLAGRDGRLLSLMVPSEHEPSHSVPIVIDLEQRMARAVPLGQVVAFLGGHALLEESVKPAEPCGRCGSRLWLWKVGTGLPPTVLSEATDSRLFWAGDTVLVMEKVINLRTGRVLGTVTDKPLALDTLGRVLVPRSSPMKEPGLAPFGPVRWLAHEPQRTR
ncbi:TolB family protein [Corallococcus interemptor]|uniref:TolB family protein n=1 Tax=Corallococcus interemptor TaxID=2316720 RepID=UPI003D001190